MLKSIFSCYFGADMSEDESRHGGGAYPGAEDPSVRGGGGGVAPRSMSCGAAEGFLDRTIVRTMGDTVGPPSGDPLKSPVWCTATLLAHTGISGHALPFWLVPSVLGYALLLMCGCCASPLWLGCLHVLKSTPCQVGA